MQTKRSLKTDGMRASRSALMNAPPIAGAWDREREQTMMQAPVNRLQAGQDMTERDNEAAYQRKVSEARRIVDDEMRWIMRENPKAKS